MGSQRVFATIERFSFLHIELEDKLLTVLACFCEQKFYPWKQR